MASAVMPSFVFYLSYVDFETIPETKPIQNKDVKLESMEQLLNENI